MVANPNSCQCRCIRQNLLVVVDRYVKEIVLYVSNKNAFNFLAHLPTYMKLKRLFSVFYVLVRKLSIHIEAVLQFRCSIYGNIEVYLAE